MQSIFSGVNKTPSVYIDVIEFLLMEGYTIQSFTFFDGYGTIVVNHKAPIPMEVFDTAHKLLWGESNLFRLI